MNLLARFKCALVKAQSASAGTVLTTDPLDAAFFNNVAFLGRATVGGNTATVKISDDDGATFQDLLVDDGQPLEVELPAGPFMIDIARPLGGSHLVLEIDRGTANTATGDIWGIAYDGREIPVEQPDDVAGFLFLNPQVSAVAPA